MPRVFVRRIVPNLLAGLVLASCVHHDYVQYEPKPIDPAKTAEAFEARTFDDPGLRNFLETNKPTSILDGIPELGAIIGRIPTKNGPWKFEQLCLVAYYYNPALSVAQKQWESAYAAQKTAGQRPNPTLTLTPGFSANPSGAPPWLPAIGADFPFESKVQRDRRAEIAQLDVEIAQQAVVDCVRKIRADLRQAVSDLALARSRETALREQTAQQQKILTLWEQRRAGGTASAGEVSAARIALARAQTAATDALSRIGPAEQRVAQTLGLPAHEIAGLKIEYTGTMGGLSPEELARLRGAALYGRSDVLGALARYASAEDALALEVQRQHPGLHLGPGYQWDQGQSKWTVALSFELPLFNHNEGLLGEAEAKRHEAEAQLVAVQAQVAAEIDAGVAANIAAMNGFDSSMRLQSETQNQVSVAEARLRAGAGDQLELESALLELAITKQRWREAEHDAQLAYANLKDTLFLPEPTLLERLIPREHAASTKPVSKKSP